MSYYLNCMVWKQIQHYVASLGMMNAVCGGAKTRHHARKWDLAWELGKGSRGRVSGKDANFVSGLELCKTPTRVASCFRRAKEVLLVQTLTSSDKLTLFLDLTSESRSARGCQLLQTLPGVVIFLMQHSRPNSADVMVQWKDYWIYYRFCLQRRGL